MPINRFGLSCERSGVKFGLSCVNFGIDKVAHFIYVDLQVIGALPIGIHKRHTTRAL